MVLNRYAPMLAIGIFASALAAQDLELRTKQTDNTVRVQFDPQPAGLLIMAASLSSATETVVPELPPLLSDIVAVEALMLTPSTEVTMKRLTFDYFTQYGLIPQDDFAELPLVSKVLEVPGRDQGIDATR